MDGHHQIYYLPTLLKLHRLEKYILLLPFIQFAILISEFHFDSDAEEEDNESNQNSEIENDELDYWEQESYTNRYEGDHQTKWTN